MDTLFVLRLRFAYHTHTLLTVVDAHSLQGPAVGVYHFNSHH